LAGTVGKKVRERKPFSADSHLKSVSIAPRTGFSPRPSWASWPSQRRIAPISSRKV
jgi:hypothetical protein